MRPINRCLNPQLLAICQRAIQLDELNSKLKLYLTPPLSEHCQVGSFNKGCLMLTVTNAAWATELRYSLPVLRDKLRQEAGIYQLTSIKIHIADSSQQTSPTKKSQQSTVNYRPPFH
ncbi:DUF721 domain-containing protein [Legionella tunisiensis]|uniref:DUF721 domain-containing protein n=1 Tax=Legionella tunisiensis TaxID=1034944 RepID=UPI00035DBC78|nr:DUF721 domain-containing protein [Legionella tunisiensis]